MRSISGRSDIDPGHANGHDQEGKPVHNRQSSVGHAGEDEIERQREADKHVASYVTDQLNRLKTSDGVKVHDEFEAQLDGT